jgi:FkbM family methyltransferase
MSILKKVLGKLHLLNSDYQKSRYQRFQKSNNYITVVVKHQEIRLHPQGQIAELLYTSDFEKEEITLVSEFIKPFDNIIDIGANIGLYSVLFRKLSKGNIVCFEPSSESYDRLVNKLKLNKIDDITLYKVALSNILDQYLELVRKPGYKDGDRHLNSLNLTQADGGDIEKVFCTTLDSYFLNNDKIDFIKIDIEGGELNAFKGAENLISSNPDIAIMFECTAHNCKQFGYERQDVFNLLKSFGLNIYAWNNNLFEWVSGEEYMNQTENFWAIRDDKKLPRLNGKK